MAGERVGGERVLERALVLDTFLSLGTSCNLKGSVVLGLAPRV